jgi:hypothetical protein
MAWFPVDDGLWGSPQWLAVAAKPRARALWVTAGSWSSFSLTDGHIPRHVLPVLAGKPADAAALVDAGLWAVHPQDGWQFLPVGAVLPVREKVMAQRKATADRVAKWREAKQGTGNGVTGDVTNGVSNAPPTQPNPTRSSKPVTHQPSSSHQRQDQRSSGRENPKGFDGHPKHVHHENAKALCVRWQRERRLPIEAPELLAWCYRLGNGDPWAGRHAVDAATEAQLDSANSPLRALRARLHAAIPTARILGDDPLGLTGEAP